jgi:hypothetical protein
VDIDGPEDFFGWLDRTESQAEGGDEHARRLLGRAVDALNHGAPPEVDMPDLKRVRQAKKYIVWRTAHPYDPGFRPAVQRSLWRCLPPTKRGWVTCFTTVSGLGRMRQFNSGSMKLRRTDCDYEEELPQDE